MLHARPFVGGVPLYRQVQSGIEDMIRDNPRAKAIPLSDAQLAERFGVSRITVRRAVDELVDAGILYRIQGRGTFVRQNKLKEKLTLNSFLDAWTPKAGGFNVRVAALERVPADDSVAESLGIRPGAEVVYIRRLRLQNETLVAIDDRYMRAQDCPRIRRQDIVTSSLADYLRNREGIAIDHGEMEIEARAADHREAKGLRIRKGQPILVRRLTFWTKKDEPVLTGTSIYRADRVSYRFTVSA
jgi:GntR family transcriptional regulator